MTTTNTIVNATVSSNKSATCVHCTIEKIKGLKNSKCTSFFINPADIVSQYKDNGVGIVVVNSKAFNKAASHFAISGHRIQTL